MANVAKTKVKEIKLFHELNPDVDTCEQCFKDIRVPSFLLDRKRNVGKHHISDKKLDKFYSTSYALPLYMYLYVKRDICGVSTFSLNGFCKWMNLNPQTGRKGNIRQIYETLCNFKDIGIITTVPSLPERYYVDKMLEIETTELFLCLERQAYATFYYEELMTMFNARHEGEVFNSTNANVAIQNTLLVLGIIRTNMVGNKNKPQYMFNHYKEIIERSNLCGSAVKNAVSALKELHIIDTCLLKHKKYIENGNTCFKTPKTLFVNCNFHIVYSHNGLNYIKKSYDSKQFMQKILAERENAKKNKTKWIDSYAKEIEKQSKPSDNFNDNDVNEYGVDITDDSDEWDLDEWD